MLSEIEVLEKVGQTLDSLKIPYMLTGSLALHFYATPRMTRDIDILIELKTPQVEKMVKAFEGEFYIDLQSIHSALKNKSIFNIIHNSSVIKIDFIIKNDEEYTLTEFARRRKIEIGNSIFWLISPEDLIISKLNWAKDSLSEMQLRDIKSIFVSNTRLDKQYMQTWIDKFDLQGILDKALYERH